MANKKLSSSTSQAMTFKAERHNVKPMLRGVALVVMVFLCLCWTGTAFQGLNTRQCAIPDSVYHFVMSLGSFWVVGIILSTCFSGVFLPFFGLVIALHGVKIYFSTLIGVVVSHYSIHRASLTFISPTKFPAFVFMELRKWFSLLAGIADSCYDLLRHNLLQYSKLLFRAGCRLRPAVGLSYYIGKNVCGQ